MHTMALVRYDERGAHIFEIEPSSNFFNSKAQAIGARSQSARTYLERNLDKVHTILFCMPAAFVCARDHVYSCHFVFARALFVARIGACFALSHVLGLRRPPGNNRLTLANLDKHRPAVEQPLPQGLSL